MNEKFEWSESGLLLLRQIKSEISKKGGSLRCAEDIESEWTRVFRQKFKRHYNGRIGTGWTQTQTDFLVKNYQTMTYESIGKYLNKSLKSVERKVERCRYKGLIKEWDGVKGSPKKIFKVTDGVNKFKSVAEAAKYIGMSRSHLNKMLNGLFTNNTNLRFI